MRITVFSCVRAVRGAVEQRAATIQARRMHAWPLSFPSQCVLLDLACLSLLSRVGPFFFSGLATSRKDGRALASGKRLSNILAELLAVRVRNEYERGAMPR